MPFQEISPSPGSRFSPFHSATGDFYFPEIVGPSVGLVDYDGDGDLDVYLVQGSFVNPAKKLAHALFPPAPNFKPGNRLFRNDFTTV